MAVRARTPADTGLPGRDRYVGRARKLLERLLRRPQRQPASARLQPTARRPRRPPVEVGDLRAGLDELADFIRDVGGARIKEPTVRGETIYVAMIARDGERYILRIGVSAYLATPPRCTFVDDQYRHRACAWPAPAPFGPFRSPHFICTPPTAEFYAHHVERV